MANLFKRAQQGPPKPQVQPPPKPQGQNPLFAALEGMLTRMLGLTPDQMRQMAAQLMQQVGEATGDIKHVRATIDRLAQRLDQLESRLGADAVRAGNAIAAPAGPAAADPAEPQRNGHDPAHAGDPGGAGQGAGGGA